eukprot:jgi/Psemu1/8856/gm1.8856_g
MSTPLNFKGYSSPGGAGGAYGTHSSSSSNNTSARQRRNPTDYGPFSSPHASFDDPVPFPPYAELPFTSLKRRRQLQENNSLVKWAMRAVLLSPVVVLLLWSVAAAMFATSHHHQAGHNTSSNVSSNKNSNSNSNGNNTNNSSSRQQSRRNKRMLPNYFGNSPPVQQSPVVYMTGSPPLQDQQGNLIYMVNGNTMMMAPQQLQQLQVQGMTNGQPMTNQVFMPNAQQPQRQQQQQQLLQQQPQVVSLQQQGSVMGNANVVSTNNLQQGQQQIIQQQVPQQQIIQQQVPQQQITQQQVPQQGAVGSFMRASQPQQVLMMGTDQDGEISVQNSNMVRQEQQMPQESLETAGIDAQQQLMSSSGGGEQQMLMNQLIDNSEVQNAASMQQQQQQQQQQPLGQPITAAENQAAGAMEQVSGSSVITQMQNQLQASPSKQAVYFYDPKDTTVSKTGQILQLPTVVYDANGKAMPLSELQYQAPIYVQPPLQGASLASAVDSEIAGNVGTPTEELVSPSARGASLATPSSREASITMPQNWGSSTSQDQTIIVATVAVMALLVGALSARRLRSKSFLSACIENESLEDDVAYDDAYTTTAAASGAMGGDSSYNTFGGWKGDLEKFDV